jgi:hypothetical protein
MDFTRLIITSRMRNQFYCNLTVGSMRHLTPLLFLCIIAPMSFEIPHLRLHNLGISQARFERPQAVVQWLGAVQAQDYPAAKWALALRMQSATEAVLDQAFDDGALLRLHLMRPTWHFVAPADIRWMLALTAPRVKAGLRTTYDRLELDEALISRSHTALAGALQGGRHLTRDELADVLRRAGIDTTGLRLSHLMMRAELDGVICSGKRRGKQHTYALLEERVPQARNLERDEALAELTRRYFTSHGPATLKDYLWWSGLSSTDAKAGLSMLGSQLLQEAFAGQTYWLAESSPPVRKQALYLLPNYDEYVVGYTDRQAIFDPIYTEHLDERANPLFQYNIVINGQIAGTWKRKIKRNAVLIAANTFNPLSVDQESALAQAEERYAAFLGLPLETV